MKIILVVISNNFQEINKSTETLCIGEQPLINYVFVFFFQFNFSHESIKQTNGRDKKRLKNTKRTPKFIKNLLVFFIVYDVTLESQRKIKNLCEQP